MRMDVLELVFPTCVDFRAWLKENAETKYHKFFTKRCVKSVQREKNKKTVEVLRDKGIMTELGERAVETAKKNGTWDAPKDAPATDEQKAAFMAKLSSISPAYENFCNMPPSVQRAYTTRYLSFKTEKVWQRGFEKIVDRLNNNLKPM